MSKKPETRVYTRIRKDLIKQVGGVWYKIWGGPFQEAGIPDLIGCCEGLFFGIEVKRPTTRGHTSKVQEEQIIRLIEKGKGYATVVTNSSEAIDFVRQAIRSARQLSEGRSSIREIGKNGCPII